MSTPGANLPLVIQQVGNASHVQEVTQRAGEVSQTSAAAEVAQKQELERTGVAKTESPAGDNRIRADERERRRQRERKKAEKERNKRLAQEELPPEETGGGVVDVII